MSTEANLCGSLHKFGEPNIDPKNALTLFDIGTLEMASLIFRKPMYRGLSTVNTNLQLGFKVQSLRIQGLEFRDSGFRVWGLLLAAPDVQKISILPTCSPIASFHT